MRGIRDIKFRTLLAALPAVELLTLGWCDMTSLAPRTPARKALLILVHGLNSDASIWKELQSFIDKSAALAGIETKTYEYEARIRVPGRIRQALDLLLQRGDASKPNELSAILEGLLTKLRNSGDYPDVAIIGHSLGGLVVMSALNRAAAEGQAELLSRIRGVMTLGTPLRANQTAAIFTGLGIANSAVARLLASEETLDEIVHRFRHAFIDTPDGMPRRDRHLRPMPSFKALRGGNDPIADEEARSLLPPHSVETIRDANHNGLATLATRGVEEAIERWLADTLTRTPLRRSTAFIAWSFQERDSREDVGLVVVLHALAAGWDADGAAQRIAMGGIAVQSARTMSVMQRQLWALEPEIGDTVLATGLAVDAGTRLDRESKDEFHARVVARALEFHSAVSTEEPASLIMRAQGTRAGNRAIRAAIAEITHLERRPAIRFVQTDPGLEIAHLVARASRDTYFNSGVGLPIFSSLRSHR